MIIPLELNAEAATDMFVQLAPSALFRIAPLFPYTHQLDASNNTTFRSSEDPDVRSVQTGVVAIGSALV